MLKKLRNIASRFKRQDQDERVYRAPSGPLVDVLHCQLNHLDNVTRALGGHRQHG